MIKIEYSTYVSTWEELIFAIMASSTNNPTIIYIVGTISAPLGFHGSIDARNCVTLAAAPTNTSATTGSSPGLGLSDHASIRNLTKIDGLTINSGGTNPILIFDDVAYLGNGYTNFYITNCNWSMGASVPMIAYQTSSGLNIIIENSPYGSMPLVDLPASSSLMVTFNKMLVPSGWATGSASANLTIQCDASVGLDVDNLSGFAGTIVKNLIDQDTSLLLQANVTASRPTASQIGQRYFDTTLGIPIWWNGSNWINAVGTIV